jgi:hypothetical protein
VTVELPTGFTALPPQEGALNFTPPVLMLPLPASPTSRGGVVITFKPLRPFAGSWFLVYDTAADAEAAFLATDAVRRPADYELFTPTGFDLPARCRRGRPFPALPRSHCVPGLAGNVIVVGVLRG